MQHCTPWYSEMTHHPPVWQQENTRSKMLPPTSSPIQLSQRNLVTLPIIELIVLSVFKRVQLYKRELVNRQIITSLSERSSRHSLASTVHL